MTVQPAGHGTPASSGTAGTSLADVIDTILDKGLVIDAFVRVSLVGIEVLTIDSRIVVASVDTYLRFAEAANRLDLSATEKGLPEVVEDVTTARAVSQASRPAGGELEAASDEPDELQELAGEVVDREERPRRARRGEDE
ncbi:putative gas vesicle structural protein 1 [Nonomuraea spiralis]|uniref:gas vesicle protein GvpJ n=1 Tax=Nonomuraea spiralis TaxID=46182 RepID=UPI00167883C6|nr:gas vesicle protein GvpJ [Nonomuraea spiralis]GGT10180.1 putative gas vesicle structural protein 1 [Nonomuraea spiralis]